MYKHTINFQIGDKFTLKNLRSISYKKYASQINWYNRMAETHGYGCSWSLKSIIRDYNDYVKTLGTIDDKNDIVCEVCKVEEDYNYLRVYLQCVHPNITNYLHERSMKLSEALKDIPTEPNWDVPEPKKPYVDHDGIEIHEDSWYENREHWSEYHGWSY